MPWRPSPLRLVVACSCTAVLLGSGCATKMGGQQLASVRRVNREITDELSATFEDTRRATAKTWSDIRKDWNYVDEDQFSEVRNAAGY
jgi:hypothetical protein